MKTKKKNQFLKKNLREGLSICLSILISGAGFLYLTLHTIQANFVKNAPSNTTKCVLYQPETIYFPNQKFTVRVRTGEVRGNEWTMYKDSASWFLNAREGTCSGNTIIWGHNTEDVFGQMLNVKMGETVELAGASGIRKYKVTEIKDTLATDVSYVKSKEEKLTIYTCSGIFDINRHFVIAEPLTDNT